MRSAHEPSSSGAGGLVACSAVDCGGVGGIIAFFAGSAMYKINPGLPFWVGSGLVIMAALLVFFFIKEPTEHVETERYNILSSLMTVWKDNDKSTIRVLFEDEVVIADARNPVAVAEAVGKQVDVTVVCVDVPGCEHGAILATADGGTVIFFSMATSFSAAALGAEGLAADVEMIVGNGYVPGHAEFALDLVRTQPGVRALFEQRQTA